MFCGGLTALSNCEELFAMCIRFEEQSAVDVDGLQEVIIGLFDIVLFSVGVFNVGRDGIPSYESSLFFSFSSSEFEEFE